MEPEKKSNGAMVGLVVIIIILIIGGIYMWQSKKDAPIEEVPLQSDTVTAQESADLDALEQDLNTADSNIDANVINSVQ